MTLYLRDPDVELHHGDALEVLRELPDEAVHCVATSPPFFGLRDYGVDGQIGLEASPDEWASRLVEVFREARRVLRSDGSMFVEVGDSYASNGPGSREGGSLDAGGRQHESSRSIPKRRVGLKPKDLIGQPFLLAFALRADGWYWRGCNIWAKPNAMPESAKDRCTVAHSYVLQFSKSARYFFDGDAISEPAAWERWGDQTVPKHEGTETAAGWIKPKGKNELIAEHAPGSAGRRQAGFNARWDEREANGTLPAAKHPRSVWTIPTQGFPEAHFATWPEALARRIILAAVPEAVCSVCGKARERIVETNNPSKHAADPDSRDWANTHSKTSNPQSSASLHRNPGGVYSSAVFKGWSDCGHNAYRPGVVLDPFAGSGTTAYVARKLGRRSIGIDLNEQYLEMAARRLQQQSLFADANG